MVIGLDQEGMVLQHIGQKTPLRIHYGLDPSAVQPAEDPFVHILRKGVGNTPGNHKDISRLQLVEFPAQHFNILPADLWSLSIDRRLLIRHDLAVDTGKAFLHMDKIGHAAKLPHPALDLPPGKTCEKPQCHAVVPQVGQNHGDIESLASRQKLFGTGAVDLTSPEIFYTDNIIEGRIKRHSIYHFCPPPVCCLNHF